MKFQHTCVSIESPHKCEGWRSNLCSFTLLNNQMDNCLLAIDDVSQLIYLVKGPSRSYSIAVLRVFKLACFRGYSLCNTSKYVDFSVPGLQSGSPALGVRIKIRILAVFSNQRYESGPKATVSTCSQVGLVMLSGELSDSVDSHSLCFDSLLKVLR